LLIKILFSNTTTAVTTISTTTPISKCWKNNCLSIEIAHQQGHGRRHQTQSGPMRCQKDSREEAELVMCDGEMKIDP